MCQGLSRSAYHDFLFRFDIQFLLAIAGIGADALVTSPQDVISYSVLRCVFRVGADNGWLRHGRNVRMLPVISLLMKG